MAACASTDVGMLRTMNQDYLFSSSDAVGSLENLYLVADGMGGHQAGDYASRYLVTALAEYVKQSEPESPVSLLQHGILEINRKLYALSVKEEGLRGMGTTLVAATIKDGVLYIANVGDSRLYLIRGNLIKQVTKDHSYVEEMIEKGKLVRNSEEYFSKKNIITRAVGIGEQVDIDFFEVDLKAGDYVLLCSDGLSNMVSDPEICKIVQTENSLEDKVGMLIHTANEHGGRDNISVILVTPQISEVIAC